MRGDQLGKFTTGMQMFVGAPIVHLRWKVETSRFVALFLSFTSRPRIVEGLLRPVGTWASQHQPIPASLIKQAPPARVRPADLVTWAAPPQR